MKNKKKFLQILCPYFLFGCNEHEGSVEINKMAYLMDSLATKDEDCKKLQSVKEGVEAKYDELVDVFRFVRKDFEAASQEYQKQMEILASLDKENEKHESKEYVLENEYGNSFYINSSLKRQNSIYSNESRDVANLNYARQRLQSLNNDKDDLRDKIADIARRIASIEKNTNNFNVNTNAIKANITALQGLIDTMNIDITDKKNNIKNTLSLVIDKLKTEYDKLIQQISEVLDKNGVIDAGALKLENLPCYENFAFQKDKFGIIAGIYKYEGAVVNNEIIYKILCKSKIEGYFGGIINNYSKGCKDAESVVELTKGYNVYLNTIKTFKDKYEEELKETGLSLYLNGQHLLKGFSKVCKYVGSYNMECKHLFNIGVGSKGILNMDPAVAGAKAIIAKLLDIFYTWFANMMYIKYDTNGDYEMLGARNFIVYSLFKDGVCEELALLHKKIDDAKKDYDTLDPNASDYLSKVQELSRCLGLICNEKNNLKSKITKSLGNCYTLEGIKVEFHWNPTDRKIVFEQMGAGAHDGEGRQIVKTTDIVGPGDVDITHAKLPEYVKSYENYLKQNNIKKFN